MFDGLVMFYTGRPDHPAYAGCSGEKAATKEFPTPFSVITRRVLQTLAIALWHSNVSHILQLYRRACHSARRVVGSGVVEGLVAAVAQVGAYK